MRRSYPERRPVDWHHPLTGCSRHRERPQHRPSTHNLSAYARHKHDRQPMSTPHTVVQRCRNVNPAAHTPDVTRTSCNRTWPSQRRVNNAQTQHIDNAHTKRARTIRSGRATYSAQALGRLPWFAPCLRRSRRLRPRFDMSFSLGLLSRLKHFCTHWPKPPRHRPFAATKVTEKRAAAQASSAHVTPRGRALSQRA